MGMTTKNFASMSHDGFRVCDHGDRCKVGNRLAIADGMRRPVPGRDAIRSQVKDALELLQTGRYITCTCARPDYQCNGDITPVIWSRDPPEILPETLE
jgi:hypothetical protein